MNTDIQKCLNRRIERDYNLYGINRLDVIKYFYEVMIPLYEKYIRLQRSMADIVINNNEDDEAMKLIKLWR